MRVAEVGGFERGLVAAAVAEAAFVDFDADREAVKDKILKEIKAKHPEFNYVMIDDFDVSD